MTDESPDSSRRYHEVLESLRPYLHLDRGDSRPLTEQLRSGIELAIFSGELRDGDLLPPVRRLSGALEIAPNTVFRAYQALQTAGVIRAVSKHGYYVSTRLADGAELGAISQIEHLVSRALDIAAAAALDPSVISSTAERLAHHRRTMAAGCVIVLGYAHSFLAERVEWVRGAMSDLGVEIRGVSFESLVEGRPAAQVDPTDVVLVPVGDWHTAHTLLGGSLANVVPMTRDLRPDVRDFIARQPPESRFGVIESTDDRVGRILANLRLLHPLQRRPITAVINNRIMIEYVVANADVLLSGGGSQDAMRAFEPISKPHMQLVSVPDEKTLRELRARFPR